MNIRRSTAAAWTQVPALVIFPFLVAAKGDGCQPGGSVPIGSENSTPTLDGGGADLLTADLDGSSPAIGSNNDVPTSAGGKGAPRGKALDGSTPVSSSTNATTATSRPPPTTQAVQDAAVDIAECPSPQWPAEVQPMAPKRKAADTCGGVANAQFAVPGPAQSTTDGRAKLVGRWVPCGAPGFDATPHDAIEFGANGRWRLLAEGADGELRSIASASGDGEGYYYAMASGQLDVTNNDLVSTRILRASFADSFDAVQFDGVFSGQSVPSIYARTDPSPLNGRDNPPSVTDGKCTMAGLWDVPGNTVQPVVPPAILEFDDQGNFIGAPVTSDRCPTYSMSGTYRLSPGSFQFTANIGMGLCQWWFNASYAATFDSSCTTLSVTTIGDNCTGGRGYLNDPTVLTRHR